MTTPARRFHYGWLIVGTTFLALLISAGVRTAPSVIIKPLEAQFHWDRASISFAVAVSLLAFGFGAPLGGSLIDRFGPRRVLLGGLLLITVGLIPLLSLSELWHLHAFWGIVVGIGTGMVANVLGATVALRWFTKYRGVVIGLFGAAGAAGQLIFLPALIDIQSGSGWQGVMAALAIAAGLTIIPVFILMRDRPQDVGQEPVGGPLSTDIASADNRSTTLAEAVRTRDFWLLAGSFFICGFTTNGLIGTHLLPHTLEHGFVETEIAGALSLMGLMNFFGTIASGWLSDRYDNRRLLAMYYGFRGLSLAALPFVLEMRGMLIFVIIYGLDWIATVPPTVNLTAQRFGRASLGKLYGWIFCAHMIGASLASYSGGLFRDTFGDYHLIFVTAAGLGLVASMLSLGISSSGRMQAVPAEAG